jgi:agarase
VGLENVATRYFEVCEQAIHRADPNHLYLGARFAGKPPDAVLRGARKVDVVSINVYDFDPRPVVQAVFKLTGRPVLIGEFAFRAENSGLPNTRGAGPKVADQPARAQAYADYVTRLESLPEAVGYHWFEWVDEPKEGRFDGEDSNYGLVDIQDRPYQEFVEAVRKANAAAREAHQKAVSQ